YYEAVAVALERLAERALDAIGDRGGMRLIAKLGEQHHELIAAEASHARLRGARARRRLRRPVVGADALPDSAGDMLQQGIAHRMTQVVVDALEAIQVQVEQRQQRPGLLG